MLQLGRGVARVVEPEHHGTRPFRSDLAELGVVAVRHQQRLRRQSARHLAPAPGNQLQLAVAVELVAKQVPERDGAGLDAARHLGQRCLVHLEQPQFGIPGGDERRGDPGDEVRAGPVVGQPDGRLQDPRSHRGGRRLAVRGRDQRRALRQTGGEAVDRTRIQLPEQLPGQGGAAPGAGEAREPGGGAGKADLEHERGAHAATLPPQPPSHPFEGTFGGLTLPGDVATTPPSLGSARISRRATKATLR